jgi:transcriptional regulator of acetoin/glycerol metabolism
MAQRKAIPAPVAGQSSLREWERWVLFQTLESTHWNISEAARVLAMGRSTLHRQIKLLRIKPPTKRATRALESEGAPS